MKRKFNLERRLRYLEEEIKSGSYDRADEAVDWLMQNGTNDFFLHIIGKTFINRRAQLWVTPEYVVDYEKQQVVDYAFWNIIAIAPEEVLNQCGIDRAKITTLNFRSYNPLPEPGIPYYGYYSLNYYSEEDSKDCELIRLPGFIWKFNNLESIDAAQTHLEFIPDSIGKCTNLKYLEISNGSFNSLPESFGNLKNLESLTVCRSGLTSLPASFTQLTGLRFLDLNECRFSEFPEELFLLPNLLSIDLSGNHDIKTLPASLADYHSVNLNLSDCSGLPSELQQRFSDPEEFEKLQNLLLAYNRKVPLPSSEKSISQPESGTAEIATPRITNIDYPEIVMSLLQSRAPENMMAALRLIQSMNDPKITEYFFSNFDLFQHAPYFRNLLTDHYNYRRFKGNGLTLKGLKNYHRFLFEFLTDPSSPIDRRPGSFISGLTFLEIFPESDSDLDKISYFPALTELTITFLYEADRIELGNPSISNRLILNNLRTKELIIAGEPRNCAEIWFECKNSIPRLTIEDVHGLNKILFRQSVPDLEAVSIKNCPDLKTISYLASSHDKPLKLHLTNCPVLEYAEFYSRAFSTINITGAPALDYLAINGKLSEMHDPALEIPSVRILLLNECGFTEVPGWLFNFKNLSILSLTKNNLTQLPAEMAQFENLEQISISGNKFSVIPAVFAKLTKLQKIRLGYQTEETAEGNTLRNGFEHLSELTDVELIEIFLPDEILRKTAAWFRKSGPELYDCFETENNEYFIS